MAILHPTPVAEPAAFEPHRWTLEEFIRLDADGYLDGDSHWELLDGEIVRKMGQNEPHIRALRLVAAALRRAFGDAYDVNCQVPLHLGGHSPEPDITVLRGTAQDFAARNPASGEVALLVEVADTRLDLARGRKVSLYSRLGIAEYWILDLRNRTLEVRRGPRAESEDWTEIRIYGESESVTPLGLTTPVAIASLLPGAAPSSD